MSHKILQVRNLTTQLPRGKKLVKIVNNISFDTFKGKTLGIVGESGSGKSITALSIMQLIDTAQGSITGEVLLDGTNLLDLKEDVMRKIRGTRIAMIFQDPMNALNPLFTIGNQIGETLTLHKKVTSKQAYEKSIELLDLVGMPDAEKRIDEYPHQLSGGQIQRVMIAMALACDPDLLIADEPTTALDVTIQSQILDVMIKLQKEKGISIIFITHDLGVVAQMCHDVAVMYGGQIVEYTNVENLFSKPMHPYTHGLLQSIPSGNTSKRLYNIPGMVPSFANLPQGCSFQDRCSFVTAKCKKPVNLEEKRKQHFVACYHPLKINALKKS